MDSDDEGDGALHIAELPSFSNDEKLLQDVEIGAEEYIPGADNDENGIFDETCAESMTYGRYYSNETLSEGLKDVTIQPKSWTDIHNIVKLSRENRSMPSD